MAARVFTIPASAPFLPTLIEALIGGKLGFAAPDPLALAAATLYLPTRRACRLARDAFLEVLKDDAAILPRIVAIGDIDEDEIAFAEAATGDIAADALALPEAVGGIERRLLLTQLITKWAHVAGTARHERRAAGRPDTGGGLRARRRSGAADRRHDDARRAMGAPRRSRARRTRRILAADAEIPADRPQALAGGSCANAASSSRHSGAIALIKAEAARLARKTDAPVIAAGSTGSIPATAELIATIARLPHGAVVLPGLDTDLDEESWRLIAGDEQEEHRAGVRDIRNSPCRRC